MDEIHIHGNVENSNIVQGDHNTLHAGAPGRARAGVVLPGRFAGRRGRAARRGAGCAQGGGAALPAIAAAGGGGVDPGRRGGAGRVGGVGERESGEVIG